MPRKSNLSKLFLTSVGLTLVIYFSYTRFLLPRSAVELDGGNQNGKEGNVVRKGPGGGSKMGEWATGAVGALRVFGGRSDEGDGQGQGFEVESGIVDAIATGEKKDQSGWAGSLRQRMAGGAGGGPETKSDEGNGGDMNSDGTVTRRRPSASPPDIQIDKTEALPHVEDLGRESRLRKEWERSLADLLEIASESVRNVVNSPSGPSKKSNPNETLKERMSGVPGTGIETDAEREAMQSFLDCVSGRGRWVYDPFGQYLKDVEGAEAASGGARGLTVHKQGPTFASCDKKFYKGKEVDGEGSGSGGTDGWDVRQSLKWRWIPDPYCYDGLTEERKMLLPRHLAHQQPPLPSRTHFCELLRHKNLLLIGDTIQYSLHDLLLDYASEQGATCYGDLYCKEHGLCGGGLAAGIGEERKKEVEKWKSDTRVFQKIPDPPGVEGIKARSEKGQPAVQGAGKPRLAKRASVPASDKKGELQAAGVAETGEVETEAINGGRSSPKKRQVAQQQPFATVAKSASTRPRTYGTIMRYRRSDGLFFNPSPGHSRHAPVFIHPMTGIREINNYALADARRSDVVVMTKKPLPFPDPSVGASKQTGGLWSNWTEGMGIWHPSDLESEIHGEEAALHVIGLAKEMTERVWLPELLNSLKSLRSSPSPKDQLVVYRGGWRSQHGCGTGADQVAALKEVSGGGGTSAPTGFDWPGLWLDNPGDGPYPYAHPPSLHTLFFTSSSPNSNDLSRAGLTPIHTLFYNVQTIIQNHLVRRVIAPAFGIPYLDMETATSVWRSGMVGGASAPSTSSSSSAAPLFPPSFVDQSHKLPPAGAAAGGKAAEKAGPPPDCSRYCFPSPGMAVEELFIGGLSKVFDWGWRGRVMHKPEQEQEDDDEAEGDEQLFDQGAEEGQAGTTRHPKVREKPFDWIGDGFVPLRERERQRITEEKRLARAKEAEENLMKVAQEARRAEGRDGGGVVQRSGAAEEAGSHPDFLKGGRLGQALKGAELGYVPGQVGLRRVAVGDGNDGDDVDTLEGDRQDEEDRSARRGRPPAPDHRRTRGEAEKEEAKQKEADFRRALPLPKGFKLPPARANPEDLAKWVEDRKTLDVMKSFPKALGVKQAGENGGNDDSAPLYPGIPGLPPGFKLPPPPGKLPSSGDRKEEPHRVLDAGSAP